MKGRRLVLLSAIVVAIIIGGWIIQQLRLESREQPVTEADLRILQRADVLLKDPASWNHYDDRRQTSITSRHLSGAHDSNSAVARTAGKIERLDAS